MKKEQTDVTELEREIKRLKTALSQMERKFLLQQKEMIAIKSEMRDLINRQNRSLNR